MALEAILERNLPMHGIGIPCLILNEQLGTLNSNGMD